jgi:hypothetical protein
VDLFPWKPSCGRKGYFLYFLFPSKNCFKQWAEKTARTMTDTVEGGTLKLSMKQWNAFSAKLYLKYFHSTQKKILICIE